MLQGVLFLHCFEFLQVCFIYFPFFFQVKSCVTAFHVTCGFKHGLEMKTVLDDSAADGVRHIVSFAVYLTQHISVK